MLHKVVANLPDILERDSIYFVRRGSGFDVFVTNHNGGVINAYPLNASENGGIDSLPDAHPETAPSHVAVTQISSYVDGGYVEEGYFTEGEPVWAKMTFEDFHYWLGQFKDLSYVAAGYVESGYIEEEGVNYGSNA